MQKPTVVIVGAGFGGLNAAKALKKADINLIVIDKMNHHLFQPLLYQVATASLSPANIAAPIREILRKQKNATTLLADVTSIDKDKKCLYLDSGEVLFFDKLIVATGSHHSYFRNNSWESFAPGLKTLEDALKLRERILLSFELAERCKTKEEAAPFLRFVIIGGGPTGVEMAGAIAEISHKTLFENFRHIHPEQAEIYLIEGENRILTAYPENLSQDALIDLQKLGVKVLLSTRVTCIEEGGIKMGDRELKTPNIIWAAGNEVKGPIKTLNTPFDRQGRAIVEPDLSLPGSPDIFVIGDAAHVKGKDGAPLPGIAPVALQQGKFVASLILKDKPKDQRSAFVYRDKGMMATIGKAKAVAVIGKLKISGFFAWAIWGLIHIFYLISFENRLIVMWLWTFYYLSNKRAARLITHDHEYEIKKP